MEQVCLQDQRHWDIFETVFIKQTLSSRSFCYQIPSTLFDYNSEELFKSSPIVTFVKLLIVDKELPSPSDLHNNNAKLKEQASLEK